MADRERAARERDDRRYSRVLEALKKYFLPNEARGAGENDFHLGCGRQNLVYNEVDLRFKKNLRIENLWKRV